MKTAGLLGGMSWESTVGYYKAINEGVKEKLGGLNSAQIIMYSINFEPLEKLQHKGDWGAATALLLDAAKKVESAGADFLLICTNTMHKVYPEISDRLDIPVIHIADATAKRLKRKGVKKVGLLGTRFTMEEAFYKSRLTSKFEIEVVVPSAGDRSLVHEVIYNELCLGTINPRSKAEYVRVVEHLAEQGAEAVILGCTEIGLLIQQSDTDVLLVDTAKIHANEAVEQLLT